MKTFRAFGPTIGKTKLSKKIITILNNHVDKSQLSKNDSMHVSMIGYNKKSFFLNDFNDSVIKLVQAPIKLLDVVLTNKKLSTEEIISNDQLRLKELSRQSILLCLAHSLCSKK